MLKRKRDLSFAFLAASVLTMVAFSQDRILYTTLRPANWDIYLFDARGGEPRRLTEDPSLDYNPAFSPDGRWVVFCSERRGNPDLYALDLQHGGVPKLLTENDSMEDAPAFSPDGEETSGLSPAVTREGRVAFSARINKQWRIVSIGSNGGEQQTESDAGSQYWAPDFDPKTGRMVCYGPGPLEDAPQAPSMNGTAPFLVWEQREEKHLPDRTMKLFASRGAAFPSFNPGATEVVSGFYTLATSEMDGKTCV